MQKNRLGAETFDGASAVEANPGFQPFGYAGGLWDADTGLVHFGAREYDPKVGRFITKDGDLFKAGGSDVNLYVQMLKNPKLNKIAQKMETNLYGYSFNDPINFFDPDGRAASMAGIDQGNSCVSIAVNTLRSCTSSMGQAMVIAGGPASTCMAGCAAAGPAAGGCAAAVSTIFAIPAVAGTAACAANAEAAYDRCMGGKR